MKQAAKLGCTGGFQTEEKKMGCEILPGFDVLEFHKTKSGLVIFVFGIEKMFPDFHDLNQNP